MIPTVVFSGADTTVNTTVTPNPMPASEFGFMALSIVVGTPVAGDFFMVSLATTGRTAAGIECDRVENNGFNIVA